MSINHLNIESQSILMIKEMLHLHTTFALPLIRCFRILIRICLFQDRKDGVKFKITSLKDNCL